MFAALAQNKECWKGKGGEALTDARRKRRPLPQLALPNLPAQLGQYQRPAVIC